MLDTLLARRTFEEKRLKLEHLRYMKGVRTSKSSSSSQSGREVLRMSNGLVFLPRLREPPLFSARVDFVIR
jgi:hypothetical protein